MDRKGKPDKDDKPKVHNDDKNVKAGLGQANIEFKDIDFDFGAGDNKKNKNKNKGGNK